MQLHRIENQYINILVTNAHLMFMYSLEGDAHEWYKYIYPCIISSLKEFHITLKEHCKRYFSAKFLFKNSFEEFEAYVQHTVICSYGNVNETKIVVERIDEESIIHESSFHSSTQKEDV